MTRVSNKKLSDEVSSKINKQFIKTMSSLGGKQAGMFFLEELLTSSEQIMLTKRLAAILMLSQGISSYRVFKMLKMSPQTTARMRNDVLKNKYPNVGKLIRKKKEKEQFWDEMEVLLRCGLPEMGKNRWKWLDEMYK